MPKNRRRTPEKPAKEALYREIPDTTAPESLTGPATVDTFDLADVDDGTSDQSVLDRWVYVQCDVDYYMRRYSGSAPASAAMQAGILWPANTIQEFYVDGGNANTMLAVEGSAAGTIIFEFGSGS